MNLSFVAQLMSVQIWTTDSKLKILEGFESVIEV